MKKVIILGAGQVGGIVAANLVSEKTDITVVDLNSEKLQKLSERLDLRVVVGNAGHPAILQEAGIEDCELLVAVTEKDEINMLACQIASKVFSVPDRVARIRSNEYLKDTRLSVQEMFDINHVICPEQIITDYICKLVEYPEALQVLEFANGALSMVSIKALEGGFLVGQPISNLNVHLKETESRIVAIFRNNQSVVPDGGTHIESGDEVFFLAKTQDMRNVMYEMRKMDRPIKQIMIAGGSDIGYRLASTLEADRKIKIIEPSEVRAKYLANNLKSALVIRGNETDKNLLNEERVEGVDLFIAASNNDERNIISSLLAKRLKVRKVIALIHESAYVDLLEESNIDIVIGLAEATIGSVLSHIRQGDVTRDHSLRKGAAEALEIIAHGNSSTSKCVGRKVQDIDWPENTQLGAIIRNQEVLMAHHDTVIESEDHLIIFVANKKMVPMVEKLLQVSKFHI
jgi:trk system potassium uptake protein